MPELNTSQKIITFATIFGVTYCLLDFGRYVYRGTFRLLYEAFGIYAREEDEVFDDREKEEIARITFEKIEQGLIKTGLLGDDDIRRIKRESAVGGKTD